MKKKLILFVFTLLIQMPFAAAQVLDVRALSRSRGYNAYQPEHRPAQVVSGQRFVNAEKPSPQKNAAVVPDEKKALPKSAEAVDQTDEIQRYIADNPQVIPDI